MKTKFRTSGYEILQFQNLMKNLLVVVKSVRLNIHIAAIINHKTMVQNNNYRFKISSVYKDHSWSSKDPSEP